MGKSRYTDPDVIFAILSELEETGDDIAAFKTGGISRSCYYAWIKKHPIFKDQVKAAKRYYRDNNGQRLKERCEHIQDEMLSEEGTITEIIDTVVVDKYGKEHPIRTVKKTRGQEWLIKRVLYEEKEKNASSVPFNISFNFGSPELNEEFANRVFPAKKVGDIEQ